MSTKRSRLSGKLKLVLAEDEEEKEPIVKRSKQKDEILSDLKLDEEKLLISNRYANRLGEVFFNNDCISLCRELLGKYFYSFVSFKFFKSFWYKYVPKIKKNVRNILMI